MGPAQESLSSRKLVDLDSYRPKEVFPLVGKVADRRSLNGVTVYQRLKIGAIVLIFTTGVLAVHHALYGITPYQCTGVDSPALAGTGAACAEAIPIMQERLAWMLGGAILSVTMLVVFFRPQQR